MVPSRIVAQECIAILTTPLLARFLVEVRKRDEAWSGQLVGRLQGLCDGLTPTVWGIRLNISEAPAAWHALMHDKPFRLGDILLDGTDRSRRLDLVVLMVDRAEDCHLLPDDDFRLAAGDHLLLASPLSVLRNLKFSLQNANELDYVLDGKETSGTWLGRLLNARLAQPRP
jgi:voltage-gated potassium channel